MSIAVIYKYSCGTNTTTHLVQFNDEKSVYYGPLTNEERAQLESTGPTLGLRQKIQVPGRRCDPPQCPLKNRLALGIRDQT